MKDRAGNIWVGNATGVWRIDPRAMPTMRRPPRVYLSTLEVAGETLDVPESGSLHLPVARFSPQQSTLRIGYVAPYLAAERGVRYRYRLGGADQDWSAPTDQRTIQYAHLGAGSYRFEVKAIDPEAGGESEQPATFAFSIASPIWRRWWFVALAVAAVAATVHVLYRVRVSRLLQLERVRTRLATDLHDHIGYELSMIAMVSEMAREQVGAGQPVLAERLTLIARTSRGLLDAMSDIVWAVNPARDRLLDLTNRMHRFADDTLGAANIALRFAGPAGERDMALDPDVRREVYLVFKEAISNSVRHSGCGGVEVDFRSERGRLELSVRDDGRGFAPAGARGGNGLASMRRRAASLGAELAIDSAPGRGTTVRLQLSHVRRG